MPDFSYRQHVFFNTSSCRASVAMWHCTRVCHSNCYRYEMRFQIGADFTKDVSSPCVNPHLLHPALLSAFMNPDFCIGLRRKPFCFLGLYSVSVD